MAEFDEAAPKKKSSWLMTCGILFVVLGLGFLAVVGVGGYYAYTMYFAGPPEQTVAGLLSVVNNTPDAAKVSCTAPDGDAWTLDRDVAAGETAQLEIGHRPADCALNAGAVSATWSIKDPPASDETWTLSLAAAEAPAPAAETFTLHNRSGWVAKASCSGGNGAWSGDTDILNGSDAEIAIPSRPASCTITGGMGSKPWSLGATAAPADMLVAWMLPEGDAFTLSATETAPAAVAAVEPTPEPTPAATTPPPASSSSKSSSSTSTSTSTSSSKPASATTSTKPATSSSTSSNSTASKPATTTTTPSTTASSTSTTTSTGTGAGGGSRTAAAPKEEEEDEELPDSSVLTAVRVEWAKGARKSTPWNVVLDGKKVGPIPTKSLVSSGVHKIKLTATGESPVECTVTAAGGEDITFAFDPENPKCPR